MRQGRWLRVDAIRRATIGTCISGLKSCHGLSGGGGLRQTALSHGRHKPMRHVVIFLVLHLLLLLLLSLLQLIERSSTLSVLNPRVLSLTRSTTDHLTERFVLFFIDESTVQCHERFFVGEPKYIPTHFYCSTRTRYHQSSNVSEHISFQILLSSSSKDNHVDLFSPCA